MFLEIMTKCLSSLINKYTIQIKINTKGIINLAYFISHNKIKQGITK